MFLSSCSPEIFEDQVKTVADLIANRLRPRSRRPGNALHPRRDIHAIAIDVVAFDDHVAEIDADAKFDAAILRHWRCVSRISRWISAAHATALTTLANSTSMPSPVSLTMRP